MKRATTWLPRRLTSCKSGRLVGRQRSAWRMVRTAAASYAVGGGPRGRALASTVSAGNRHTVKVHGTIAIMMMWNATLGRGALAVRNSPRRGRICSERRSFPARRRARTHCRRRQSCCDGKARRQPSLHRWRHLPQGYRQPQTSRLATEVQRSAQWRQTSGPRASTHATAQPSSIFRPHVLRQNTGIRLQNTTLKHAISPPVRVFGLMISIRVPIFMRGDPLPVQLLAALRMAALGQGLPSDYVGSTSGVRETDPMQARRTEVTVSVSTFPPAHRRTL
jgi:hypothetical protein